MGYDFTIKNGFTVKERGRYPWPCEPEPKRTIELFPGDVLTKNPENGTYMKHTGLGCFNIILSDAEVEPIGADVALRLL